MKIVVIASNNAHKVAEIETALDFEGGRSKPCVKPEWNQTRLKTRARLWATRVSRPSCAGRLRMRGAG